MRILVFADVICPWCYIGTANLRRALAATGIADETLVEYRSFQLDPDAPPLPEPLGAYLGAKYGRQNVARSLQTVASRGQEAGITIDLHPEESLAGNTRSAHRLVQAAADAGVQEQVVDALFQAHFARRESIFDDGNLRRIAVAGGMSHDQVDEALGSEAYAQRVFADRQAARLLGITGVPFFVVDDRFGISGAQPVEVLADVLKRAGAEDVA